MSFDVLLILYDVKSRGILQTFVAFEIPYNGWCKTYFVNHVDFERGIITAMSYNSKEIRLFTRHAVNKFIPIIKHQLPIQYCVSNCKDQLLVFQVRRSCN